MNDSPHPSPADLLERRTKRLSFWVVWGFAVFDVMLALFQPMRIADVGPALLGLAAVTCQVSLLTIWVAMGQKNLRGRLLSVAPAYLLAAWFLATFGHGGPFARPAAVALLLLVLFNAIIPYGILQLLGVRHLPPGQIANAQNIERRRAPVQFSLAALFKMTFVAACTAGIIRLLKPRVAESVGEIALLGLSSLFGLGGIWSMLMRGALIPRTVLFCVVSILGGIAIDRIIAALIQGRPEPWIVSIWVAIHLAAMLAVLLLYRLVGYRVGRSELVATPSGARKSID